MKNVVKVLAYSCLLVSTGFASVDLAVDEINGKRTHSFFGFDDSTANSCGDISGDNGISFACSDNPNYGFDFNSLDNLTDNSDDGIHRIVYFVPEDKSYYGNVRADNPIAGEDSEKKISKLGELLNLASLDKSNKFYAENIQNSEKFVEGNLILFEIDSENNYSNVNIYSSISDNEKELNSTTRQISTLMSDEGMSDDYGIVSGYFDVSVFIDGNGSPVNGIDLSDIISDEDGNINIFDRSYSGFGDVVDMVIFGSGTGSYSGFGDVVDIVEDTINNDMVIFGYGTGSYYGSGVVYEDSYGTVIISPDVIEEVIYDYDVPFIPVVIDVPGFEVDDTYDYGLVYLDLDTLSTDLDFASDYGLVYLDLDTLSTDLDFTSDYGN